MRKYLFFLGIVFILFEGCGSHSKGVYPNIILLPIEIRASQILQPLEFVLKDYNFTTCTFNKTNFIYKDSSKQTIIDTLPLAYPIQIQTTFGINAYGTNLPFYHVVYPSNGDFHRGVIFDEDIAYAQVRSARDTSVIYMAKYINNPTHAYNTLLLRTVDTGEIADEMVLAENLWDGYDLDVKLVDGVKLKNADDVILCHYYYPACGQESIRYYLTFREGKLALLCNDVLYRETSNYTSIYFPVKKKKGIVMSQVLRSELWEDQPDVEIPAGLLNDTEDIIMTEKHYFEGSEYETTYNKVVERRWLMWDGRKMTELKVETF